MFISSLSLLLLLTTTAIAAPKQDPPAAIAGEKGVSLEECYQRALKISESLAIEEQEIAQLEAIYRQGVGNVLPAISWRMTQQWQDTSGVEVDSSTDSVRGTFLRKRTPESYLQLTQPLFHGLRDFNAIRGFKAARRGAELNLERARLNLLADVAHVFYTSLDLQQEVQILGSQRQLLDDRRKELERRVRLGRSRDSEVLSSQVEIVSLDAQMEDTHQRLAAARQMLQFLTQVPPETPLIEQRPAPVLIPLDRALAKSVNRADLRAAAEIQTQERYRLRYAKGGFFPDLDFTGRYYTERVGFNEDVKWDALLALEVPIFSGFITRAEVQQARAQLIAADLAWARRKREIDREVHIAHQNLRYILSQTQFYERAVDLAQKNYQLQQQEYRLGLINNLQVLQVLTDLQDLKLRKQRSATAARLNDVQLRVAMGQGL